jgi:CheY-like chemotaxis protein
VLTAQGPRQALEFVRSQAQIDVVLSDVRMPEMQGTDLVSKLAEMLPQTTCILMTAGICEPDDVPKGVPLLRKPISTPDLIAAVKDAIAQNY